MASEQNQRVEDRVSAMASSYDSVIPFFATFAERLVGLAGIGTGDRVLDLACGTGRVVAAAAAAVGDAGLVVGTDLAMRVTQVARQRTADAGLGAARLAVGDAEHLCAADAAFDAVTCGFGVFFFPEPGAALREAARVLRPGGHFAATTFADGIGGYEWAAEVSRSMGHHGAMRPSPVLTHDGLEAALAEAGFTEIVSTPVEGRFVFPDVDQYLAWCWSTGVRRVLSGMSDEELDRYRTLSAERLDAHAVAGGYEMRQPANVTVAVRP